MLYLMALVLGSILAPMVATTSYARQCFKTDEGTEPHVLCGDSVKLDKRHWVSIDEDRQTPDWHERLPSSPVLDISIAERALIVKAMEIVQAREVSRQEMTISWVPTLAHVKSGGPISLADFIVFQGSLMMAQQIRNDGHDTTPEENQKINDLRHKLYKQVAGITSPQ